MGIAMASSLARCTKFRSINAVLAPLTLFLRRMVSWTLGNDRQVLSSAQSNRTMDRLGGCRSKRLFLHKKWAHFHNKQLQLSHTLQPLPNFADDGMDSPTCAKIWHCGMLFAEWNAPCVLPQPCTYGHVHASQPLGKWIRRKDFIQSFFGGQHRWVIREHPNWLAPIASEDALTTIEIMDILSHRGFLMLAKMSPHTIGWRETSRWVLVDDDWGVGYWNISNWCTSSQNGMLSPQSGSALGSKMMKFTFPWLAKRTFSSVVSWWGVRFTDSFQQYETIHPGCAQ